MENLRVMNFLERNQDTFGLMMSSCLPCALVSASWLLTRPVLLTDTQRGSVIVFGQRRHL